jgi:hypothetical protein
MKNTILILIALLPVFPSFGQISQNHPELCGKPDSAIPIPPNVSAIVDRWEGHADLAFGTGGSAAKISLPGVVDEIEEVCLLPNGRFIVFGTAGDSLYNVNIIDPASAVLLDSFYGFTPGMSPNQRWLAYRKFYPRHTELQVSDEYLLYDLSKTAAQNRPPGIGLDDHEDVGLAIFPLGQKNVSGDHIGLPEDQRHETRSWSFLWAPDSRAVVFADSCQGKLSIVLVRVDEGRNTTALVHPISVAEICGPAAQEANLPSLDIPDSRVEAEQGGDRLIHLSFQTGMIPGCEPKRLELRASAFQPVRAEVHVEPNRKGIIIDQQLH